MRHLLLTTYAIVLLLIIEALLREHGGRFIKAHPSSSTLATHVPVRRMSLASSRSNVSYMVAVAKYTLLSVATIAYDCACGSKRNTYFPSATYLAKKGGNKILRMKYKGNSPGSD